ncbi:protein of unknown function [Cupriavidus taiwanensis]|nr:protein of unknown function [Cupriavidus taiwanensis]
MALGVLISFRILNFPDLTVDGSFPLGGAVAATLIAGGQDRSWRRWWPSPRARWPAGSPAGSTCASRSWTCSPVS